MAKNKKVMKEEQIRRECKCTHLCTLVSVEEQKKEVQEEKPLDTCKVEEEKNKEGEKPLETCKVEEKPLETEEKKEKEEETTEVVVETWQQLISCMFDYVKESEVTGVSCVFTCGGSKNHSNWSQGDTLSQDILAWLKLLCSLYDTYGKLNSPAIFDITINGKKGVLVMAKICFYAAGKATDHKMAHKFVTTPKEKEKKEEEETKSWENVVQSFFRFIEEGDPRGKAESVCIAAEDVQKIHFKADDKMKRALNWIGGYSRMEDQREEKKCYSVKIVSEPHGAELSLFFRP